METKETIVKNLRQVLPLKAIHIRLHSKKVLFDQRILFHYLQREEQENSIVNTQFKISFRVCPLFFFDDALLPYFMDAVIIVDSVGRETLSSSTIFVTDISAHQATTKNFKCYHHHHYYCSNQKPQNHHVASFINFICNGMEKWYTYKTIYIT
uniref:Uncharacterized protein n=1 Tax=Glossina palpalis gambiensis TaxID=67801 RepID=A0A1B0B3H3_9MUSC